MSIHFGFAGHILFFQDFAAGSEASSVEQLSQLFSEQLGQLLYSKAYVQTIGHKAIGSMWDSRISGRFRENRELALCG